MKQPTRAATVRKNALTERGCIAFNAIDQPLVTTLCDVIKSYHTALREHLTEEEIAVELDYIDSLKEECPAPHAATVHPIKA